MSRRYACIMSEVNSTTKVQIRAFEPGDYERLSEISHANNPEYDWSAEEFRRADENFDRSKYILRRIVAVESERRRTIAVGQYKHQPWMFHPRKFWFNVHVDPEWQHRGIGTAMYSHIAQELGRLQAVTVRADAREDKADAISFLQKRGFSERMRAWESRLRVREFDFSSFTQYAEKADSQGIRVSTLAEETRTDPESYRKLHELVAKAGADEPLPDKHTPISFETFLKQLNHPDVLPDCCFIAKDRERYVGLSEGLKSEKEPKDLYQAGTAVLPEYRGRGIAMALKLKVIEFAGRNGFEVVKTQNDSTNVGMLHINQKLGFRRHVGWITFEKNLTE